MSIPGICRVCLRTNRRLSAINNTVLQETLERLTSTRFNTSAGIRLLVCYVCRAQLKRSSQLMQRAMDAEEKRSQNSVPLSLTQGLDYNFVITLAPQIECRKIKRKTLKEIKIENEENIDNIKKEKAINTEKENIIENNDNNIEEEENNFNIQVNSDNNIEGENNINYGKEKEVSQQEESLDSIDIESDTRSCDDIPVKNKCLKEILGREVRIILHKIDDIVTPSRKCKLDQVSPKVKQMTFNATNKKPKITNSAVISFANNSCEVLDTSSKVNYCEVNNVSPNACILPNEAPTKNRIFKTKKSILKANNNAENKSSNQILPNSSHVVIPTISLEGDKRKSNISDRNGSQNDSSCHTYQYKCGTKSKSNIHIGKHIVDKPFICDLCDYRASKKDLLKRHMQLKHIKVKNLSCHMCQFKCVTKIELNRHLREHTGKYLHICNICECKFSRKSHLINHIRYKHTKEKTFSCYICQFKCVTNSDLKKHLNKHTGEKPFICDLCDYRCTRKGHLEVHVKYRHTKEKNFLCHICHAKYVIKSDLNKHLLKHSREKPFVCNLCEFKCSQKGGLKTHMQHIHTKEKNFSCHICQYMCVSKGNLSKHLRKHTAEKAYICEVCDHRCSSQSNLNSHIIAKHTK